MPKISSCLDFDESFINELKKVKVYSLLDFINSPTDKLISSSLSARNVLTLKHKLISKYSKYQQSGSLRYNVSLKKSAVLPTDIKSLDNLLNGGLETGLVYEITGLSGSGKTRLCFSILTSIVGKMKRKVFYLDAKNDFSAHHILRCLQLKYPQEDLNSLMEKITVVRINDICSLISTLSSIRDNVQASSKYDYRLLILDSICATYLGFIGKSFSKEGYSSLMEVGSTLKLLAREMHMVIIVTNLAIRYNDTNTDFNLCFQQDQLYDGNLKPALGRPWSHVPHTRLFLQKSNQSMCSLTVMKSNSYPYGKTCIINVSEEGILT